MMDLTAPGLKMESSGRRFICAFSLLVLVVACSPTSPDGSSPDPPETQNPPKPQIATLYCSWLGESFPHVEPTVANAVYDLLLTHDLKPLRKASEPPKRTDIRIDFENMKGVRVARCHMTDAQGPSISLFVEDKWYYTNISHTDLADIKSVLEGAPTNRTIPEDVLVNDFSGEGDILFHYRDCTYKITFNDVKALMTLPNPRRIKDERRRWREEGIAYPIPKRIFIAFFSDGDSLVVNWREKCYSAGKGSLPKFTERADSIAKSRKKVDIKDGSPKEDVTDPSKTPRPQP